MCATLRGWIVHAAQTGLTGCYDAIGPSQTRRRISCRSAPKQSSAECSFTWVDRAFLERHDVRRWSGPRSLPMWLPLPEFAGFATRDTTPARDAGLTLRPLAESARDTLAWARAADGAVTGLTADEERSVLAAWHAERAD